jgi:hypothetical protein
MSSSPLQIDNLTRNTPLVTAGRVADNFWSRFVGLMGVAGLAPGEGLLILPCNSIHTHFMRFPIDVLYVSRGLAVVHVDRAMAPWRFGRIHRQARFVVELPAGAAEGTEVGHVLAVKGCSRING